jgi:hypothetical protein
MVSGYAVAPPLEAVVVAALEALEGAAIDLGLDVQRDDGAAVVHVEGYRVELVKLGPALALEVSSDGRSWSWRCVEGELVPIAARLGAALAGEEQAPPLALEGGPYSYTTEAAARAAEEHAERVRRERATSRVAA